MQLFVISNAAWLTFLISFLPLFELKGAIPLATSVEIWGCEALSVWHAFFVAFLGSSLSAICVALLFKPVVTWLSEFKFFRKILSFLTSDIQKKGEKFEENGKYNAKSNKFTCKVLQKRGNFRESFAKMLTVFLFVAFPVPLTGVWMGSALGITLGLGFFKTCLSVIFGNFVCGLLVCFVCSIFPSANTVFLIIFVIFAILSLFFRLKSAKFK